MDLKWLFLRWLLIVGLVAGAIAYLRSDGVTSGHAASYEAFPLIRGKKSSGMPLAGISVDPSNQDVYAIIGSPPDGQQQPFDFFIVWKSPDGKTYAATFGNEQQGGAKLVEIGGDGALKLLKNGEREEAPAPPQPSNPQVASLDRQLRPIFDALPPELRQP